MKVEHISRKMYQEGLKDEDFVMQLTQDTFGCDVRKSTRNEDIFDHVDFWCKSKGKEFGIDVKGLNRNSRHDSDYDDTMHWVELQNVHGNPGWLFGKSVYIAFITKRSVLFVPTKDLIKLVKYNTRDKKATDIKPEEFYQPYTRRKWGRNDLSVKVPNDDLRKIAKHEIKLDFEYGTNS